MFLRGSAAKRAAEVVAPDCAPEPKRARVVPPQNPADTSTPNTSFQISLPAPSMQPSTLTSPAALPTGASVSQPAPQPGHQSNSNKLIAQIHAISVQRKQLGDEMKLILNQRSVLTTQGNIEQLNLYNVEFIKRRDKYQKFTQILVALHRQLSLPNPQSQGVLRQDDSQPSQPNSSAPLAPADNSPSVLFTKDPQTPVNPATTPRQPSATQSPNINPQMTPVRSISNSGVPTSSPSLNPLNIPVAPTITNSLSGASGLNAQMQKLLQIDRSRLPQGTSVTSSTGVSAMSTEPTVTAGNAISQPLQQQLQLSNPSPIVSVLVWEGILSFNGTGSDGSKKEVHTRVSASSSNASNRCGSSILFVLSLSFGPGASHSETWPPSMTLLPAQTPAISIPDFQDWIRRTKPVLCTFKAKTPEDESNYAMLVSVMSTKRMVGRSFITQIHAISSVIIVCHRFVATTEWCYQRECPHLSYQ